MHEETDIIKSVLNSPANRRFTFKRYEPSEDLAPFIEHYWIIRWDMADGARFDIEILPYPSVHITITSEASEITGLVTGKFARTISGNGVVLGVKFKPGGFYPFYKKPIDRLTNQTTPLNSLFTVTRIKRVTAELDKSDRDMVTAFEKLLRAKRPEYDPNVDAIEAIISRIQHDKELTTVQAVCDVYGLSERTLQHTFQRYVGIGLKWIISRYRIQDIADAIESGEHNWTQLAQDYGFTDQPHFIRDFTKVVGETPAQYGQRPM